MSDNKNAKRETKQTDFSKLSFDLTEVANKKQSVNPQNSFEPMLARDARVTKAIETVLEQAKEKGIKTISHREIVKCLMQIPELNAEIAKESIPTDTVLYGYGYTKYGQEQKRFEHDKLNLKDLPIRRTQAKPKAPFVIVLND